MFPWQDGAGVSRNDVDEEVRRKTREIVKSLEKPHEDAGLVARTAAFGKTATDLSATSPISKGCGRPSRRVLRRPGFRASSIPRAIWSFAPSVISWGPRSPRLLLIQNQPTNASRRSFRSWPQERASGALRPADASLPRVPSGAPNHRVASARSSR